MDIFHGWSAIDTNLHWTICLEEIPLSKGVKHISELTMTLAKMANLVFGRNKDFKGHWYGFWNMCSRGITLF